MLDQTERTVTVTETVTITTTCHFHDGESETEAAEAVTQRLHAALDDFVAADHRSRPSRPDRYQVIAHHVQSDTWPDGCPDCAEAYAEERNRPRT